jgi:two-component system LytT family response regulator
MNLTCYIVDDEFHAIGILKNFVENTPGLELVGTATDPLIALEEISSLRPAFTFLDVDMPTINGLQFAGMVNSQTTVIFTTAFREYAVEAFEKEAADYLLKPISYERFLICIQKVRKNLAAKTPIADTNVSWFFVKTGIKGKLQKIGFHDILYISGCDHYIEIRLQQQKIITYLTMNEIQEKLPAAYFTRIHKSHIINHEFIHTLEPGQVKLQDLTVLPIGRSYRLPLKEKLNNSSLISKWHH